MVKTGKKAAKLIGEGCCYSLDGYLFSYKTMLLKRMKKSKDHFLTLLEVINFQNAKYVKEKSSREVRGTYVLKPQNTFPYKHCKMLGSNQFVIINILEAINLSESVNCCLTPNPI